MSCLSREEILRWERNERDCLMKFRAAYFRRIFANKPSMSLTCPAFCGKKSPSRRKKDALVTKRVEINQQPDVVMLLDSLPGEGERECCECRSCTAALDWKGWNSVAKLFQTHIPIVNRLKAIHGGDSSDENAWTKYVDVDFSGELLQLEQEESAQRSLLIKNERAHRAILRVFIFSHCVYSIV
jgi:hypothetical protein